MRPLRNITYILLAATPLACATSVKLTSSPPGVEVWEDGKKLGTTPIELTEDILQSDVADGHLINFAAPGYKRVWMWLPSGLNRTGINVNLQPFFIRSMTATTVTKTFSRTELDRLGAKILDVQSRLIVGAEVTSEEVDQLLSETQGAAVGHYLKGLLLARNNDQSGALNEMQQAVKSAPSEPDYVIIFKEMGGDVASLEPAKTESSKESSETP